MNIIVVDDETSTRKSLKGYLEQGGHSCKTAPDARQALALMERERIDILISDFSMPKMNGLNNGAKGFLEKPICIDELKKLLNKVEKDRMEITKSEINSPRTYNDQSGKSSKSESKDRLTGLLKRDGFIEKLTSIMNKNGRDNEKLAVFYINLGNLKDFNDSLGFAAGDEILQTVAARIKGIVRSRDVTARVSGSSFAMSISKISHKGNIVIIANKIIATLEKTMTVEGQECTLIINVGIVIYPNNGSKAETLIIKACSAKNSAALKEGSGFKIYSLSIRREMRRRLMIENGLRKALKLDQFTLHYQPKVNLCTGECIGAEALLRWKHGDMGMISPAEFIPIAEESGLMEPIGKWVLKTACEDHIKIMNKTGCPLSVSVNISAIQLKNGRLFETVCNCLERASLDPKFLELEITESIAMDNIESTIRTLNEIIKIGVLISIDDFGTGYSSLAYLRRLPVNILKVDRRFIASITSSPKDAAIISSIIEMAHTLEMKVVAEGVENKEQYDILNNDGCDVVQGYYYSRPLSLDKFERFIQERCKSKLS